jgi:small subunit ribosomal protein S16
MGRKKRPYYRIIAIDSRRSRDGAYIERLGHYHPLDDPPAIKIDAEKALKWLRVGAQPSETVRSLLQKDGIWLRFLLEKRGMPEEQINETMTKWYAEKSANIKEKPDDKKTVEAAPSEKPIEEVKKAEKSDQPEISQIADAQEKPVEKKADEPTLSEEPLEEVKEAEKTDQAETSDTGDTEAKAVDAENANEDTKAADIEEAGDTVTESETTEKADASDDTEKETEEAKD